MNILIFQEKALHENEIRQNKASMSKLLHPEYREIGMTGKLYDYQTIVSMMEGAQQPVDGYMHAQDFECIELSPEVMLLVYKSAWVNAEGFSSRFARRSSIWVLDGEDWQMKFHQGTRCDPYELIE